MRIAIAFGIIAAAWGLLLADIEPIPTWFYVIVWYPTLVLFDELGSLRTGTPRWWNRPRVMLPMLAWSVPIWLLFEAANFRLRNWYYVMLPAHPVERWAGITLSFATVVPAVLLASRLFDQSTTPQRNRPALRITRVQLRVAEFTGLATGALALAWPALFFPLIWGAVWLAVDPFVYRRRPDWSLLGDLERGHWGRIVSLLVGGLLIGFFWEFYNHWARGQWIYTVPWLEEIKLFEMPPFGFLGFPVFALEAWTLFHAVCAAGLAQAPSDGVDAPPRATPTGVRSVAMAATVALSVLTLLGMERLTISSTVPQLDELPTASAERIEQWRDAGHRTVLDLAKAEPSATASQIEIDVATLAALRGIGIRHVRRLLPLGIDTVCRLAVSDPGDLWTALHADSPSWDRPTAAEVRVWVRAARRNCPTVAG